MLISADSASVAISGLGESFVIWDWEYDEVLNIDAPAERPHRLAIDAENLRFVSISQFGVIDVWDLATDYFVKQLDSYNIASKTWASQLGLDAGGHRAVIGYENGMVEVWDLDNSPANHISDFNEYPLLYNATYLSDTQILLDGARENQSQNEAGLAIWNSATNEIMHEFFLPNLAPSSLVLSADRRFAAIASETEIFVFDLETEEQIWTEDSPLRLSGLAFNPSNSHELLVVDAESISLWDIEQELLLRTYAGQGQIAFSPDSSQFLSSASDGKVMLWDTSSGEILREFELSISSNILVFHPNGSMALRASQENSVTLWDLETGATVQVFRGHEALVQAAVFSTDASRLWTASADGAIIAWDVATGTELYLYALSGEPIWDIDISPNGENLLSVTSDSLIIWRTDPLSLEEVVNWTYANRFIRPLTERECRQFYVNCSN